jgi:hypothetical protein
MKAGKVTLGVVISVIGFAIAYAEVKADAVLTEFGLATGSNEMPGRLTEVPAESESRAALPEFEYFPRQYHNNAESKSPEDHIQAF